MKTQLLRKKSISSDQENICLFLWELKEKYGASGLKLSTEDAGMSFEQIVYWTQIVSPVLPVVVKIGGPEARNDMKMLSGLNNISGVIAPMIESDYSLQNYISSLQEIFGEDKFQNISKQFNIETITAFKNLSQILSVPEINVIEEITIGRGDLSRSVMKEVDDPEVCRMSTLIVKEASRKSIKVSVGGAVNPKNAQQIFESIKPDKINTRSVVFNKRDSSDIEQSVLKALEFEIIMMEEDFRMDFVSKKEAKSRIEKLKKRMTAI